ncbi:6238_t:CDS:1, partial [Dentiscutata heterogama]
GSLASQLQERSRTSTKFHRVWLRSIPLRSNSKTFLRLCVTVRIGSTKIDVQDMLNEGHGRRILELKDTSNGFKYQTFIFVLNQR